MDARRWHSFEKRPAEEPPSGPNALARNAIFSAPPDFHRTGLSSRGYSAGAERMAPLAQTSCLLGIAPSKAGKGNLTIVPNLVNPFPGQKPWAFQLGPGPGP